MFDYLEWGMRNQTVVTPTDAGVSLHATVKVLFCIDYFGASTTCAFAIYSSNVDRHVLATGWMLWARLCEPLR